MRRIIGPVFYVIILRYSRDSGLLECEKVFLLPWSWWLQISLKCWYLCTKLCGLTSQKTVIFMFTIMKMLYLIYKEVSVSELVTFTLCFCWHLTLTSGDWIGKVKASTVITDGRKAIPRQSSCLHSWILQHSITNNQPIFHHNIVLKYATVYRIHLLPFIIVIFQFSFSVHLVVVENTFIVKFYHRALVRVTGMCSLWCWRFSLCSYLASIPAFCTNVF